MQVVERCGIEYDEYCEDYELILAKIEMDPPLGHIGIGTISGKIINISCRKNGEEVVGFHFIHLVCHDLQPEYSIDYKIKIVGEPNLEVTFNGLTALPHQFATSTAPSVNLIPRIVEAPPGFLDALDLPVSNQLK